MSLSVAAILAESARRRPDHPAIVFGPASLSYAELWLAARRYAAVLRAHGIGPGDRVVLILPNTPHFPMAYYGALALGATVVPVPTLLRAAEIAHVLRDCDAAAVICAAPLLDRLGESAATPVFTVLEAGDSGRPRLDVLAAQQIPIDAQVPRDPRDIALILYTSGTTGLPKGAMLTQLNIVLNVEIGMDSPFAMEPGDVLLGCLPLFHTFGQICGMHTVFRAGATMVLMERFDGPRALDLMTARRCTVFMGVPTMYLALLAATPHRPLPRLDRAFSGGSALPVRVLEEFQARFDCPIYEGYGLTETSPVVAYNQRAWPCKPGTVGKPIWGVDAEIARADIDDRIELLPPKTVGEIVIRGHNVMAGYLNRPEATAEAIVDGWFRSGDLGVKDAEGYLSLVDRKKDMIIRGGYNVYPREVEEVLMRHPAIAQAAVIGIPDDTYGAEVCAVVVPDPDADDRDQLAADIIAWSRKHLAAYKYPRQVRLVESLPLGPTGKVLKRELATFLGNAERYAADLGVTKPVS
ncbi:long-chain fatty acid--CoA ligase [Nocardia sp. NPDC052566]|uniref:long-chain fatty acid--CoA ligase n=1 Tax=Nocardia sp. NPDC052566 TaxID=3364330 RepID=UPI0037C97794